MNLRGPIFTFIFSILICFSANGQSIDRGPYLQTLTGESIFIKWRTDSSTDSKVWYGDSPSNLNFTVSSPNNVTDHELMIDGLDANTIYFYAVGNSNGQMMGGDDNHYFLTTPDTTGSQTVRLWVLGDCGTANDNQREVRDAYYNFIGSNHIDGILLLGDNAYTDGTQSEYQMALFENMYEEKLVNSVLWPSFGNHDGHSSLSETQTGPYYDIFTVPKNGEAGGEPSNTEAYYSFDYGNIHFICINSDDIDADPEGEMVQWIEEDINATNQEWIVAFFHHPPYTGEGGNESDFKASSTDMRENVLPVLEAGNVDLVLTGHTHAYQRSYLINGHYDDSGTWDPTTMGIDLGDGRLDGDGAYYKSRGDDGIGTVYIVAGSSGKLDSDDYNYPAMHHNAEKLGSVAIDVEGLEMNVQFIDNEGFIEDYFTILKMVDPPSVEITYPEDQEYFPVPEPITITADASDANGSVEQVEFFIENNSIGIDDAEPYEMDWTIPSNGTFTIKAVATDNDGYFRSSIVTINVGELEICSKVSNENDDAEEKEDGSVSLTSGDLELVNDGTDQVIGIRFQNLNIPQCAEINSAFIQFTTDDADNINPCNLTIYAEASDNSESFSDEDNNISNRPKTTAFVNWSPADWLNTGEAGQAQKTVDISTIIQDVANRPGFTSNSPITIIIEGEGLRSAESYDADPSSAPEICIEYHPNGPDDDNDGVCNALDQCPGGPEPGMACDDGDPDTSNDTVNSNCECEGTTTFDCPNLMLNIGDPCDDGDPNTSNDTVNSNCECEGTTTFDCPTLMLNIGDPCDDGDPNTSNDTVNSNCECEGTTTFDCPNLMLNIGDSCEDGDPNTSNDTVNSNCECEGTSIFDCPGIMANIGDPCDDGNSLTYNDEINSNCDCNGILYDCPSILANIGDPCDDGDPNTSNDIVNSNCECEGTTTFDCPTLMLNIGDPCDDGDPDTSNDTVNSNCECEGSITFDCPNLMLNIGDPCDDGDPNTSNDMVNSNCECEGTSIFDCPGIMANIGDPCDDGDPNTSNDVVNSDCECEGELMNFDCPEIFANIGDPCDDGDPNTVNDAIDETCECIGSSVISINVQSSSDDAEEDHTGTVNIVSSDLEMINDDGKIQTVGIRFPNLGINHGAIIESAYLQFTTEDTENINPCELVIYGQDSDNATTFSGAPQNISNRQKTSTSVQWLPSNWNIVDESTITQRTFDLSAIIQEIVDRDGFNANSSIAFIIEGQGNRTAYSFDGDPDKGPQLNIQFKNSTVAVSEIDQFGISPLLVYPVPTSDQLNVSFSSATNQTIPIVIRDLSGKVIRTETRQIQNGKNVLSFNDLNLKNGMYLIQLNFENVIRTSKFIILK